MSGRPATDRLTVVLMAWVALGGAVGGASARLGAIATPAVPPAGQRAPLATMHEHRYRMSAGVRPLPLPLMWITKDNVGLAQIVWRTGEDGAREHELLIGSDPTRAPRRVNRWGFVREWTDGQSADVFGLMTESGEQSLEEARARIGAPASGPIFKMVKSRVRAGDSESETRTISGGQNWSYRDLAAVVAAFDADAGEPRVLRRAVPETTRPGFLVALADLLHESVEAARSGGKRPKLLRGRQVSYVFGNTLYRLTLVSATLMTKARIDGRDYGRLLRHEFETLNLVAKSRERFALTCAIEGALAEIPVQISYQPKWWFKAELVIDDRVVF